MANGTYQVTAHLHNQKGHHWENVFHYKVTGSPTTDSKFATSVLLADAWLDKMLPKYLDLMGSDTTLDVVAAKVIDPPPGNTATSISGDGSGAADVGISSGVGCNVTWIDGGDTGRFTRTFIGNVPGNALLGDQFTPAYIAKIDEWAVLMLADLAVGGGGGTAKFVHWVRKTKNTYTISVGNVADKATMLNKRTVPNN